MESRNKLYPLKIEGAFCLSSQIRYDERGSLTRIWENQKLLSGFNLSQASYVSNPLPATLRGLHYQEEPFAENKLIHCVSGLVVDAIIDLRQESKTYLDHVLVELGPESIYQGLFVPKGCAHGYLSINANSNLIYFMDKVYSPKNARGLLWNDPILKIKWPIIPAHVSERDSNWPILDL